MARCRKNKGLYFTYVDVLGGYAAACRRIALTDCPNPDIFYIASRQAFVYTTFSIFPLQYYAPL